MVGGSGGRWKSAVSCISCEPELEGRSGGGGIGGERLDDEGRPEGGGAKEAEETNA